MKHNDFKIFLTVGNEKQKRLCEKILSSINTKKEYNFRVLSDDELGFHLGSGGAVLNILKNHYVKGSKMLIINSGGMSKRSFNYSLRGKAFATILFEDNVVTLLELIVAASEKILKQINSGVIICCSDILVNSEPDISFNESFGVGIKTDFETASRHGVFLCDSSGRVLDYLHKRPPEELKHISTGKKEHKLLVDTGVTFFSEELSLALCALAKEKNVHKLLSSGLFETCLYSDIIYLLAESVDRSEYLSRETKNQQHHLLKEILFDRVSSFSMRALEASEQKFLHFGSSTETVRNCFHLSGRDKGFILLNGFIDEHCEINEGTVLDNVQLKNCKIGKNCLISDITAENIFINDNKAVCGIRLADGAFVTLICDLDENPKLSENGISNWEKPRYYKADSFSQSLEKYYAGVSENKYSMAHCVEKADYDYFFTMQQYLKDIRNYTVSPNYLQKREEIISHHKKNTPELKEIKCSKEKTEVFLPLRINLSGTWTDAMPYCTDNGGQVINMAVLVDGKKPVKVVIDKLNKPGIIEFCSDGVSSSFNFKKNSDDDMSDFILHKAALSAIGITEKTNIIDGFRLTTDVKGIDKGSGLGTSSILLGGCFIALNEMFNLGYSEKQLLKMVFVAEQIMKTGGGWQDQAGGLTPGLKAGTTTAGIEQDVDIKSIPVSGFFEKIFSEKAVLLPTGQRHFGRFIVNDVVNRYLDKNPESIEGHKKIRELNSQLIKSLETDDYQSFTYCINKHRELLKLISPKVTNSEIDFLVDKCFEKADAVSYLGAGGGGYLLVVLNEETDIREFKSFIKREFPAIASDVKKIDICY